MEPAQQDEDAAEIGREAQEEESDEDREDRRWRSEIRSDVPLIEDRKVAVRDLAGEKACGGEDREEDGVPVADLAQAPPRLLLLHHGRRPTTRRILMSLPLDIAPRRDTPALK